MSEEIQKTYHAVEKNGVVTAIWEMAGKRHVRTIDPRSNEGKSLLRHYNPNAPQDTKAQAAENGK
ncbi:MAG: hypothetical protein K1Y36_06245 [Blastocatellia bacterium]|nr:hypothetical protein [Blastocatellia bacterium]